MLTPYCFISCLKGTSGCPAGTGGLYDSNLNYISPITPIGAGFLKLTPDSGSDSPVGNVYQKWCHKSGGLFGGDLNWATSSKVVIVSEVPCEVDFQTILDTMDGFFSGQYGSNKGLQPTSITEIDFKSWVTNDTLDHVEFYSDLVNTKPGSGDKEDIMNRMGANRSFCDIEPRGKDEKVEIVKTGYTVDFVSTSSPEFELAANSFFNYSQSGYPFQLSFELLDVQLEIITTIPDGKTYLSLPRHVVIVTKMQKSQGPHGDSYSFDIIDPNFPKDKKSISNCEFGVIRPNYKNIKDSSYYDEEDTGLLCSSSPYYDEYKSRIYLHTFILGRSDRDIYLEQCNKPVNIKNHPNLCVDRKGKISEWLENNRIDLENFVSIQMPLGNCSGWVNFVMDVAHFGDFVGTDFHPGDGKYMSENGSTGCNFNYPPTAAKSSWLNPQNWLANLQSVIWKF